MTDAKNPNTHAREIIDRLPDSATWDDIMYELYVREAIDAGLADVTAGRTFTQDEVRARLREVVRRAPTPTPRRRRGA
jgi:predicted transcriptional regulator